MSGTRDSEYFENVVSFVRGLQEHFDDASTPEEAIGEDEREILMFCDPSVKAMVTDLVATAFNVASAGKDPCLDPLVLEKACAVFDNDNYWETVESLVTGRLQNLDLTDAVPDTTLADLIKAAEQDMASASPAATKPVEMKTTPGIDLPADWYQIPSGPKPRLH